MSHTAKMTDRQAGRSPTLPALRDALLDAATLGVTLRHCFDSDILRDTLTIAHANAEPRLVFSDDEGWLCCRLDVTRSNRHLRLDRRRADTVQVHDGSIDMEGGHHETTSISIVQQRISLLTKAALSFA